MNRYIILFLYVVWNPKKKKKQISKNVTETKTMIRIYLMGLIELLVYSTMNSVVVGRNLRGKIFFFFPVKGRGKNFLYIKIALTGVEELQPSVSLHNSRNSTLMVSSGTRARFIQIQKKCHEFIAYPQFLQYNLNPNSIVNVGAVNAASSNNETMKKRAEKKHTE